MRLKRLVTHPTCHLHLPTVEPPYVILVASLAPRSKRLTGSLGTLHYDSTRSDIVKTLRGFLGMPDKSFEVV